MTERLAKAGAKFGPDHKDEMLKNLQLNNLATQLGKVRIKSVEFVFGRQGILGPPVLLWHVLLDFQVASYKPQSYEMMVEPFAGDIVVLQKVQGGGS